MEIQVPNFLECSNPNPQSTSPSKASSPSSSSSSSTSAGACANNGVLVASPTLKPLPRPIETAPSTTFVQADPSSFKQVVQMLTGSPSSSAPQPPPPPTPTTSAARSAVAPKKPSFKLYERRGGGGLKSLKTIGPLSSAALRSPNPNPSPGSPWGQGDVPSPSVLGFRSLTLSPVTPLSPDGVFNRSPRPGPPDSFAAAAAAAAAAEERAIAEKGFYFHPSPRGGGGAADPPPRLLSLFPVTSPKFSSSP